jgi:hypothetical protein
MDPRIQKCRDEVRKLKQKLEVEEGRLSGFVLACRNAGHTWEKPIYLGFHENVFEDQPHDVWKRTCLNCGHAERTTRSVSTSRRLVFS